LLINYVNMDPENGKFYRDQFFKQLDDRLSTIEDKLDKLNTHMVYVYGFAAGVGLVASFIITWLKSKFYP